MKFAIKPAMMYLIILKHLFFNIEVTLPLWCLLFLPQMRIAKTISSAFKHFLKRLLSFSFPRHYYFFFFFLLWKSRCSKATSNWKPAIHAQRLKPNIYDKLIQWEMSPQWPWSWSGNPCGHWPWWDSCHLSEPMHCDSRLGTFLTSATLYLLDTKSKINMKSILTTSHSIGFTIAI